MVTPPPLAALANRRMGRALGNWPELLRIQQAARRISEMTIPLAYPFISYLYGIPCLKLKASPPSPAQNTPA